MTTFKQLRTGSISWLIPALLMLAATAVLWASSVEAKTTPGAPSSVTVTRGDGTLNVSWPAVDGATSYNVNTTDDGKQSWSRAKSGVSGTSATLTGVSNNATYVVAVQAVNSNGGGGWRDSASVGPYTPPNPPATTPPATPSSVSISRGDGTLTASWPAADGAEDYHVTYSSNGGASWSLAAYGHASTGIDISVSNGDTYVVGVRAMNAAGGSGWRNSASAGAVHASRFDADPHARANPASRHAFLGVDYPRRRDAYRILARRRRCYELPRDLQRRRQGKLESGRIRPRIHQHRHRRRGQRFDVYRGRPGRRRIPRAAAAGATPRPPGPTNRRIRRRSRQPTRPPRARR